MLSRTPESLLNDVFGYPQFRGFQRQVIETVLAGQDALVLMPTGGGKSLTYQIPALLRKGAGVVISPLIALMQDQVAALHELGVRAAFLNSTLSSGEAAAIERRLRGGELDLVYIAPERLMTERAQRLLGDLAGGDGREIVLAQMDTVSSQRQGNIGSVVDDDSHAIGTCNQQSICYIVLAHRNNQSL